MGQLLSKSDWVELHQMSMSSGSLECHRGTVGLGWLFFNQERVSKIFYLGVENLTYDFDNVYLLIAYTVICVCKYFNVLVNDSFLLPTDCLELPWMNVWMQLLHVHILSNMFSLMLGLGALAIHLLNKILRFLSPMCSFSTNPHPSPWN